VGESKSCRSPISVVPLNQGILHLSAGFAVVWGDFPAFVGMDGACFTPALEAAQP
jgi:hypothetical protein